MTANGIPGWNQDTDSPHFLAKNFFEWRERNGDPVTNHMPTLRCDYYEKWTTGCNCWTIDGYWQPLWYYPDPGLLDNGNANQLTCMTLDLPDPENEEPPVWASGGWGDCADGQAQATSLVIGQSSWPRVFDVNVLDRTDGARNHQIGSGYYPDSTGYDSEGELKANMPRSPYGCRIIGRPNDSIETPVPADPTGTLADQYTGHAFFGGFGSSFTVSDDYLVVTAPYRDASPHGAVWPDDKTPVDGISYWACPSDYKDEAPYMNNYPGAGVGYMFRLDDLWAPGLSGDIPPKPHMYMAGGGGLGYTTANNWQNGYLPSPKAGPYMLDRAEIDDGFSIIGNIGEHIRNIVGIEDFNGDSRPDLAIGSPEADFNRDGTPEGALYVAFRRTPHPRRGLRSGETGIGSKRSTSPERYPDLGTGQYERPHEFRRRCRHGCRFQQ